MQRLLLFAINLGIVGWLRTATITRPRSSRLTRWFTELGFGLLSALPLLV